jgi:hypothetical protein
MIYFAHLFIHKILFPFVKFCYIREKTKKVKPFYFTFGKYDLKCKSIVKWLKIEIQKQICGKFPKNVKLMS